MKFSKFVARPVCSVVMKLSKFPYDQHNYYVCSGICEHNLQICVCVSVCVCVLHTQIYRAAGQYATVTVTARATATTGGRHKFHCKQRQQLLPQRHTDVHIWCVKGAARGVESGERELGYVSDCIPQAFAAINTVDDVSWRPLEPVKCYLLLFCFSPLLFLARNEAGRLPDCCL